MSTSLWIIYLMGGQFLGIASAPPAQPRWLWKQAGFITLVTSVAEQSVRDRVVLDGSGFVIYDTWDVESGTSPTYVPESGTSPTYTPEVTY